MIQKMLFTGECFLAYFTLVRSFSWKLICPLVLEKKCNLWSFLRTSVPQNMGGKMLLSGIRLAANFTFERMFISVRTKMVFQVLFSSIFLATGSALMWRIA
jgi:hypothetical protein